MLNLENIDLSTDPHARPYVKTERVAVAFARAAGELISLEGPNRYAPGDALITASGGERWVVSRDRFDAKYRPLDGLRHGEDGAYTNLPSTVLARQIHEPFSIARSRGGDRLNGEPGDWLMQYAPGDFGITRNARFVKIYRAT